MRVKVLLTSAGERIISAVGEITKDEQGIGFILKCPYILSLEQVQTEEKGKFKYNVNFTKWIPYSSSEIFEVPYSSIVTLGEVEPEILDIYMQRFGDKINDTTDGGNAGDNGTSDSGDSVEEPGVSDSAD